MQEQKPADDWIQLTPYEERESQHVGAKQAAKWYAQIGATYLIGMVCGRIGRQLVSRHGLYENMTKNWNWLEKTAFNTFGDPLAHGVGMVMSFIRHYMIWKKDEKSRLGIHDMFKQFKDVAPLHMSNEEIRADNALTQKMIAFERRQQEKLQAGSTVQHSAHQGKIEAMSEKQVGLV